MTTQKKSIRGVSIALLVSLLVLQAFALALLLHPGTAYTTSSTNCVLRWHMCQKEHWYDQPRWAYVCRETDGTGYYACGGCPWDDCDAN